MALWGGVYGALHDGVGAYQRSGLGGLAGYAATEVGIQLAMDAVGGAAASGLEGLVGALPRIGAELGAAARGPTVTLASGGATTARQGLTPVRVLERGEKWADVLDEMRYLQWATGEEHYLISFRDRSVRMFSGGNMTTFEFTEDMRRLLAHTHPLVTGPSDFDRQMMTIVGQRSSWLLEPGFPLQRIRP